MIGLFYNKYSESDPHLEYCALNIEKEFFVFYLIGLVLLMLWSLGILVPYTITGFLAILLITTILNSLLKKINRLNLLKIRLYKRLGFTQY
jgi:hypothetical protein